MKKRSSLENEKPEELEPHELVDQNKNEDDATPNKQIRGQNVPNEVRHLKEEENETVEVRLEKFQEYLTSLPNNEEDDNKREQVTFTVDDSDLSGDVVPSVPEKMFNISEINEIFGGVFPNMPEDDQIDPQRDVNAKTPENMIDLITGKFSTVPPEDNQIVPTRATANPPESMIDTCIVRGKDRPPTNMSPELEGIFPTETLENDILENVDVSTLVNSVRHFEHFNFHEGINFPNINVEVDGDFEGLGFEVFGSQHHECLNDILHRFTDHTHIEKFLSEKLGVKIFSTVRVVSDWRASPTDFIFEDFCCYVLFEVGSCVLQSRENIGTVAVMLFHSAKFPKQYTFYHIEKHQTQRFRGGNSLKSVKNSEYMLITNTEQIVVLYRGNVVFRSKFMNPTTLSTVDKNEELFLHMMHLPHVRRRQDKKLRFLRQGCKIGRLYEEKLRCPKTSMVLDLRFFNQYYFPDIEFLYLILKCEGYYERYCDIFMDTKVFVNGKLNISALTDEYVSFVCFLFWMKQQNVPGFYSLPDDVLKYCIIPFLSQHDVTISFNEEIRSLRTYEKFQKSVFPRKERLSQKAMSDTTLPYQLCECEFENSTTTTPTLYQYFLMLNHFVHVTKYISSEVSLIDKVIDEEGETFLSLYKINDFQLVFDVLKIVERVEGFDTTSCPYLCRKLVKKVLDFIDLLMSCCLTSKKFKSAVGYDRLFASSSVWNFLGNQFLSSKTKLKLKIISLCKSILSNSNGDENCCRHFHSCGILILILKWSFSFEATMGCQRREMTRRIDPISNVLEVVAHCYSINKSIVSEKFVEIFAESIAQLKMWNPEEIVIIRPLPTSLELLDLMAENTENTYDIGRVMLPASHSCLRLLILFSEIENFMKIILKNDLFLPRENIMRTFEGYYLCLCWFHAVFSNKDIILSKLDDHASNVVLKFLKMFHYDRDRNSNREFFCYCGIVEYYLEIINHLSFEISVHDLLFIANVVVDAIFSELNVIVADGAEGEKYGNPQSFDQKTRVCEVVTRLIVEKTKGKQVLWSLDPSSQEENTSLEVLDQGSFGNTFSKLLGVFDIPLSISFCHDYSKCLVHILNILKLATEKQLLLMFSIDHDDNSISNKTSFVQFKISCVENLCKLLDNVKDTSIESFDFEKWKENFISSLKNKTFSWVLEIYYFIRKLSRHEKRRNEIVQGIVGCKELILRLHSAFSTSDNLFEEYILSSFVFELASFALQTKTEFKMSSCFADLCSHTFIISFLSKETEKTEKRRNTVFSILREIVNIPDIHLKDKILSDILIWCSKVLEVVINPKITFEQRGVELNEIFHWSKRTDDSIILAPNCDADCLCISMFIINKILKMVIRNLFETDVASRFLGICERLMKTIGLNSRTVVNIPNIVWRNLVFDYIDMILALDNERFLNFVVIFRDFTFFKIYRYLGQDDILDFKTHDERLGEIFFKFIDKLKEYPKNAFDQFNQFKSKIFHPFVFIEQTQIGILKGLRNALHLSKGQEEVINEADYFTDVSLKLIRDFTWFHELIHPLMKCLFESNKRKILVLVDVLEAKSWTSKLLEDFIVMTELLDSCDESFVSEFKLHLKSEESNKKFEEAVDQNKKYGVGGRGEITGKEDLEKGNEVRRDSDDTFNFDFHEGNKGNEDENIGEVDRSGITTNKEELEKVENEEEKRNSEDTFNFDFQEEDKWYNMDDGVDGRGITTNKEELENGSEEEESDSKDTFNFDFHKENKGNGNFDW